MVSEGFINDARAVGPDQVARLSTEKMWAKDVASRMLGMHIVATAPGTATVSMRVRADMVNGWELCHGGLIAALADSSFALACNTHGTVTVSSGFELTFLESARLGDELIATAQQLALRGRSGLYDVTVRRASDDIVIAEFRGRSRGLGRPNPALSLEASST